MKLKLDQVVVVEGKYDKIKLSSIIDALIITTDGFGIFKDSEKQKLLRTLAKERGLLVITDSDGAGFVIRNFLNGCVDPSLIKHCYVPQLRGKEKRKSTASKEGYLGVEGIDTQTLLDAINRAGVTAREEDDTVCSNPITSERLFDDGFIGGKGSAQYRKRLMQALGLPTHMSTSALIKTINLVTDMDGYERALKQIAPEQG